MRRSLLILLVACTLVVAMVPRHRRAEDTENDESEKKIEFCAPQTPCGWSIYNKKFKNLIELNVTNTYCICTEGQLCSFSQDDVEASAFVYRCVDKS